MLVKTHTAEKGGKFKWKHLGKPNTIRITLEGSETVFDISEQHGQLRVTTVNGRLAVWPLAENVARLQVFPLH